MHTCQPFEMLQMTLNASCKLSLIYVICVHLLMQQAGCCMLDGWTELPCILLYGRYIQYYNDYIIITMIVIMSAVHIIRSCHGCMNASNCCCIAIVADIINSIKHNLIHMHLSMHYRLSTEDVIRILVVKRKTCVMRRPNPWHVCVYMYQTTSNQRSAEIVWQQAGSAQMVSR
jgi:hypothetical protein